MYTKAVPNPDGFYLLVMSRTNEDKQLSRCRQVIGRGKFCNKFHLFCSDSKYSQVYLPIELGVQKSEVIDRPAREGLGRESAYGVPTALLWDGIHAH